MGLDMYAHRKHYVKNWEHQKPEERFSVRVERGGKPYVGIRTEDISEVCEEVMYWRKANHIHKWFVDNVQNGEDNCAVYYVGIGELSELLEVCEEVINHSKLVENEVETVTVAQVAERLNGLMQGIASKVIEDATVAKKLLPTYGGVFYGGDEYDEYYLDEVVRTRNWLVRMLDDYENGSTAHIYYTSSW